MVGEDWMKKEMNNYFIWFHVSEFIVHLEFVEELVCTSYKLELKKRENFSLETVFPSNRSISLNKLDQFLKGRT